MPAAAFGGTGKGLGNVGMGLETQGAKSFEMIAQIFSPDRGKGDETGEGFEDGPVHKSNQ